MKEIFKLFDNQKYRRIIMLSLFLSCVIFVSATYELITSYRSEVKRAETLSRNLSKLIEAQLLGTFEKVDRVMLDLVRNMNSMGHYSGSEGSSLRALIAERKKDLPKDFTFIAIDKSGNELSGDNKSKRYFGEHQDFILKAESFNNELLISKPMLSRRNPIIYLSRRITNAKNEFIGIISTGVPLTYFVEFYSTLDIGKEGAIDLSSGEEVLYSRYPWNSNDIGKALKNPDIIEQLFKQKVNVYTSLRKSQIDSRERYSSARRVGKTKLYVNVGISKEEVLANWKYRSTLYLLGFVIMWISGGLYLINFLRSLVEVEERRKMAIQNAKLTSLGEMASGIAHEINNPLTIISTRSMQLHRQIERGEYEAEVFKESLIKINTKVERIAKIIRGLKSFSRNEDNDSPIPISLKIIIENTLELCSEKFRHQRVILKVDSIPDVLVVCRETQMVQVFLNLLNNSFDAVENLENKWVHISFFMNKTQNLTIVVVDSGPGIPAKIAGSIMQPFFTTKEVGKGTGLGLSISKGIIESLKGKLYLDQASHHTRFVIEVPACSIVLEQSA